MVVSASCQQQQREKLLGSIKVETADDDDEDDDVDLEDVKREVKVEAGNGVKAEPMEEEQKGES